MQIINDEINIVFENIEKFNSSIYDEDYSNTLARLLTKVVDLINCDEDRLFYFDPKCVQMIRNRYSDPKTKNQIRNLIKHLYDVLIKCVEHIYSNKTQNTLGIKHQKFFLRFYNFIKNDQLEKYSQENLFKIQSFLFQIELEPGWNEEGQYMNYLPYQYSISIDFILNTCIAKLQNLLDVLETKIDNNCNSAI